MVPSVNWHYLTCFSDYLFVLAFSPNENKAVFINIDNRVNASATKDLLYEWYFKILSKLHKPLNECNLKETANKYLQRMRIC